MGGILESVKKTLGVADEDDAFDRDIIMHINSVFSMLDQLGVGPEGGFMIEDRNATWEEYLIDQAKFNLVRSYLALRVRLLFDPPATSFHLAAMEKQITEFEWRLNVAREGVKWVSPIRVSAIV